MKSLKHKEDKEEQSEQQDTEHDHTDEYEVRSEEEIPAIEKIINDKKAKKKKTLMVATAAIVCIAVAAAYLLMPKKPDKLPINLGAMPIKEAQEARNPGSTKQQPQAPTQADILANPAPPDPATPAAALQEDTRNGYEKTAQWWKDYVDKALQIQQVLDKRYKEMEAENPTGKKEVPKLFSKEIARIYPGSVYNGQEGYLQMTPQQQIYFDSTMSVTKIVMNDQYQRIYTFRSPTGAKQNDFQIIRDKESITVDLDANIPNNCRFKGIEMPAMQEKINAFFKQNPKMPKPPGEPTIVVLNKVYERLIANAPNRKYNLEAFSEMIMSNPKVREYIVNYTETQYTP